MNNTPCLLCAPQVPEQAQPDPEGSAEASELRPRLRCALVTALGAEHGQSSTSRAAAASVLASSAASPRLAF